MGWAILLVLAAAAFASLALLGAARSVWSMIGSALMLGAAGYALQGRPSLPGSPARPTELSTTDSPDLIDLRDRLLGRYGADGAYVTAADAMMRTGDPRAAAQATLGGIAASPQSVLLWTELGTVLAAHDGGQVSPPALFAFQQAARLAPQHPGPPFFLGQAYVRANDFAAARRYWRRALVLSSAGTSYRRDIAVRLALLDRYLSLQGKSGALP